MSVSKAIAIVVAACAVGGTFVEGARGQLEATVRLTTGEFRLTNVGATPFDLVAYTITLSTEELDVANWDFISGQRDGSPTGDGTVDPLGTWIILQPEMVSDMLPATADEVAEAALTATSATILPGGQLYLGPIWNTSAPQTLAVEVAEEDEQPVNVSVAYIEAGDYNEDGVVNSADYELWRQTFGAVGEGLLADGNGDQQVSLADYTIWRDNLGAGAPASMSASFAIASSSAIPEPSTMALLMLGWAGLSMLLRP